MRILTISELWDLTRVQLVDRFNRIISEFWASPEDSPKRANALTSLRNIRFVLTRRDFSP